MNKDFRNIGFDNGKFSPLPEITIPVDNLAIGRAYAAYEFFGVHKGRPFYLDRHLDRFFNSLEILKFTIQYSRFEITEIIYELIQKNQITDFYVKIFAIPQNSNILPMPSWVYIIPAIIPAFSKDIYSNGTSLLMKEYARFLPEAKSNNYIASVFWQAEMDLIKAVDVLFVHDNQVFESSRGNIFIVKNEKVYTPDDDILKGVTRSIVLELMENEKIEHFLRNVSINELINADEIFLTSTTKLIMPVVRINDKIIGNGLPGPITKRISAIFNKLLE